MKTKMAEKHVPKKRYTVEQRLAILRDAKDMSNPEVFEKYDITATTLWKWRKQHEDVVGPMVTARPRGRPDRASIVVPNVENMRRLVEVQKLNTKSKRVKKDVLRDENSLLKQMVANQLIELMRLRHKEGAHA